MSKWLPFLSVAAVTGVSVSLFARPGTPERAAERTAPAAMPAFQQRSINVTQLFNDNCSSCHGVNGDGGGAGTQSLNTEELFKQEYDKKFFDAIKNGVPDAAMPAYGETNSDEAIWALVVHIRELQAKALRAKNGSPKPVNGVYKSDPHHEFKIETVVDTDQGLQVPWAIDWLPDGRMLVTNRGGKLSVIRGGKAVGQVRDLPEIRQMGQGGLMDIEVHPDYAKNGWIYLSFADASKTGNGAMTKIVRGKIKWEGEDAVWHSQETIFEADQKFYFTAGVHFGSRIRFDGKGHVFFTIGERGQNMPAQSLASPVGKTYRLNDDGSIPADNPFASASDKEKGSIAAIWTLGHRNQQGLAIDLKGNVFVTEHGPRGGDELNLIQRGANYGWPVVAWSINYNDSPYQTPWPKDGLKVIQPVFRWIPSIGACGLDVVNGAAFPEWKGDLVAGGLAGQNLDRFRVVNGKMVERTELIHGMGRIREVEVAKDGTIYIALNDPDKIIRLVPVK